jgi:hypothetical protein
MKHLTLWCLFLLVPYTYGQSITVHVYGMQADGKKTPLKASLSAAQASTGMYTDSTGSTQLTLPDSTVYLLVSATGYGTDTLWTETGKTDYYIMLFPVQSLNQVDISVRNYDTKMDLFKTIKVVFQPGRKF